MHHRAVRHVGLSLVAAAAWIAIAGRLTAPSIAAASDPTITETTCFLRDGAGSVVSGTRSGAQVTLTTASDGSVSGYCSARVAPPADGTLLELTYATTGVRCTIATAAGLSSTENWRETIAADGFAQLWCSTADAAVVPSDSGSAPASVTPTTTPGRRCRPRRSH